MTQIVTRQDKAEWKTHPVTKEFYKDLLEAREAMKDAWAKGGFTSDTVEATALADSNAIGNVNMLQEIIDKVEHYGEDE